MVSDTLAEVMFELASCFSRAIPLIKDPETRQEAGAYVKLLINVPTPLIYIWVSANIPQSRDDRLQWMEEMKENHFGGRNEEAAMLFFETELRHRIYHLISKLSSLVHGA